MIKSGTDRTRHATGYNWKGSSGFGLLGSGMNLTFEDKEMKKKLTVRFVVERDFELRFKDGEDWLPFADAMVNSGFQPHDYLTHDNIFEYPLGGYRSVTGHWYDSNLYNLTAGSGALLSTFGQYTSAWLEEGETDPLLSFDDDEEEEVTT